MTVDELDPLPIILRAYAGLDGQDDDDAQTPRRSRRSRPLQPSDLTLTFDTETTTDEAQQLRFGVYHLRRGDTLIDRGLFYDPFSVTEAERAELEQYAREQAMQLGTVAEFVESIFYPTLVDQVGVCVGFNLPFDLSRVALGHQPARGKAMRGGFSFKLSEDKRRPRLQIKHLNGRAARIQFTSPGKQRQGRSRRNRGDQAPVVRRGFFIDVRTVAGAICGGSWSLGRLADHLGTPHRKIEMEEYSGPITRDFIRYAEQDVQATWECYAALRQEYAQFLLSKTALHGIYSEATLGKARLHEMGIRPWRECQPDFPPELLGIIMSTYYGGRAEVHIRRQIVRLLYCDFLSMYPTVCTLMRLWRFVIAKGVRWSDATQETRQLLERIERDDLRDPRLWQELAVLVQIAPDDDVLPVRSAYGTDRQATIAVNRLSSTQPLWYTLADVIAAKLLGRTVPRVIRAIRFEPEGIQPGLPAAARSDFYKGIIDQRNQVKAQRDEAYAMNDAARGDRLDKKQHALKILANATSYGIFVEMNVTDLGQLEEVTVYPGTGEPFRSWVRHREEPGRYFHPLLATLITGAARLMLALAERLAEDAGISWAFCDTDSMALAMPEGMSEDRFLVAAFSVVDWFTPLNPYTQPGRLFKLEDANFHLVDGEQTQELEPLYGFCVGAKRHALFNLDASGRPALRKASAHGLGHLRPPYAERQAPRSIPAPVVPLHKLEVERWQHDLWYRIVDAALQGRAERVRLDDLPGFDLPAVSRYTATTPALLHWFDAYNRGRAYRDHVKPFNFLLAYQPDRGQGWTHGERMDQVEQVQMRRFCREQWAELRERILHEGGIQPTEEFGPDAIPRSVRRKRGLPADVMASLFGYDYTDDFLEYIRAACMNHRNNQRRGGRCGGPRPHPVAPYDTDPDSAVRHCFDRITGVPVPANQLKTYRQALAQYHLHPEGKFYNGDYLDAGRTSRRHVLATGVEHIGKEANRWEEQFFLGIDPDAQIEYGAAPQDQDALWASVLHACQPYGVRQLAQVANVSLGEVSALRRGERKPSWDVLLKLRRALPELERAHRDKVEHAQRIMTEVRVQCQHRTVRQVAGQAGVDARNLAHVLSGRRKPTAAMLAQLEAVLKEEGSQVQHASE